VVVDPQLITRARHGDNAAWEELVRAHQEPVFRLAYLLLGDRDEAEDIAQETFILAFRSISRFIAERPLRPWLLQITTNLVRNRRRSLGRYLATLQRAFQPASTTTGNTLEEWAGLQAEAHTLWQAVRQLPPQHQEVIYLRYFLDLSEAEIARTLNVAAGTVKSRANRALTRLRTLIERDYPTLREEHQS
jgi:RNA polymerase sigma-70 factor, ECF subfamily